MYNLFKLYNTSIFIFNLIPIPPLDGYNILNLLFNKLFSYKISLYISIFSSLIFLTFLIYKFPKTSYILISFLIYKIYEEYKNIKYLYNKFCIERIINNYTYRRFKIINNILHLKRETNHYIIKDGNIYSEEEVLLKKYNKNIWHYHYTLVQFIMFKGLSLNRTKKVINF